MMDLDKYSLFHVAIGIVIYFWSLPFLSFILFNLALEYTEATAMGKNLKNTYLKGWWPGGKSVPTTFLARSSDTACMIAGMLVSYGLDH
uniref:Uncharacterized protein n=1 Tax=viral metagenome TaxID=1070528 RepID=A0A6C0KVM3_9ZZZZ